MWLDGVRSKLEPQLSSRLTALLHEMEMLAFLHLLSLSPPNYRRIDNRIYYVSLKHSVPLIRY